MAITKPSVLIPNVAQPSKWAVIACDQFTGQPEYWDELTAFVGDAPSALRFVLPEVWLEERLAVAPAGIASAMTAAVVAGHFDSRDGFVLVERTLASGVRRLGLIAAIDLAEYEFTEQSNSRIRATEKTVVERLPARVKVRESAPLETPHVIVFINDPAAGVIEQLYANRENYQLLYDFSLNMGGGKLRGWLIPDDEIAADLLALEKDGLLAVVGDGNHSLAAAKLTGDTKTIVEIENIHSDAIDFEPIHRVIYNADDALIFALKHFLDAGSDTALPAKTKAYYNGNTFELPIPANPADAIADIQGFLDDYQESHPEIEIDYIHGDGHLISVANRNNGVAIFLPPIAKAGLFEYVARRGVLPRKSFSVGEPQDKRYYYEAAARQ
ncbi:MAG: DUF1015 domain-containing protein [Cellulomonadaceae bacterium]|nr:DUF1015 domain-containing protein [Cellulomonadaceae bacterium]